MAKLVKSFIIFGPVQGSIKVVRKYANPGQTVDESLMSTLCLPRIELVDSPEPPRFQTFLVTKENGQVLYGSGLIVHQRHDEPPPFPGAGRYASFCYTLITDTPFINATRSLLHLIVDKNCDDFTIRSVMNIPLPARRTCLRIVPPLSTHRLPTSSGGNSNSNKHNSVKFSAKSKTIREETEDGDDATTSDVSPRDRNDSCPPKPQVVESTEQETTTTTAITTTANHDYLNILKVDYFNPQHRILEDIYLYRGMTDLPLLDYPLRQLFTFLQIDDFLLAFACILMEFRTLIISEDNYKLMMVGETLTSLLLPLKWCNVYVPILPPVYGATYLDAPTSYIMGINTQVTELPDNLNHIQCRIHCDEGRVVCDADSLTLPLFLNDIKKDIMKIAAKFQQSYATKPFTYLDDLKFNRAIRVLFLKTIRKNILANYERYIVDVPESSRDIRQFDVVSYLSDQPEFMHSFLSKLLDTQLFASFVDENAKRIQQSWLSIFDMEPEELSEHFTDKALEQAFQSAHRIHLSDLLDEEESTGIEIKNVPASPMKIRRRVPALQSIVNRLTFASRSSVNSTSVDIHGSSVAITHHHNDSNNKKNNNNHKSISSSPPAHRNSVATVQLKGHLAAALTDPPESPAAGRNHRSLDSSDESNDTNCITSPKQTNAPMQPNASGKILELINEVKDLTKRILVDSMGSLDLSTLEDNQRVSTESMLVDGRGGNSSLIGALCDLIERVWAHGAFAPLQQLDNNTVCCPLWNHLIAFTRLKYLDSRPKKHQFADGSHLNVLTPPTSGRDTTELDLMVVMQQNNHHHEQEQQKQQLEQKSTHKTTNRLTSTNPFKSSFNWFGKSSDKLDKSVGPLARDLINDLRIIHTLREVKTDVGKARAFIRLSLERKKLSKHLKTLLGDQTLLNTMYKPYAFLRYEEEREQFLMYLLTLNAVDLPCFTTTFVSVINTRKMKT